MIAIKREGMIMEGKRATELKLVDEVKRIFEVPPSSCAEYSHRDIDKFRSSEQFRLLSTGETISPEGQKQLHAFKILHLVLLTGRGSQQEWRTHFRRVQPRAVEAFHGQMASQRFSGGFR